MVFRQIYEEGLAQASYFIGCPVKGAALVVDPRRDIDIYLQEAAKNEMRIAAVAETHIHADYLSGARELAHATGAALYLSDEGDENWKYRGLENLPHQFLKDGDEFKVGRVRVRVLHTPGHTPEHISFLIMDAAYPEVPMMALTGDFVFVGDVGRPDLLEEAAGIQGTAEPGAHQQFQSLISKFVNLEDFVQVWPGHGAGSACGKALGAVPASTVGYESRCSWWAKLLRQHEEQQFVNNLLEGQPEAPTYFARMKRLNRDGMPVLGQLPQPPLLSPDIFMQSIAAGAVLVDTRERPEFAAGHMPGSINIPVANAFSTWAGWLLPYEKPIILLTPVEALETLVRQLIRVGLDDIVGHIPSLQGYTQEPLQTVEQIQVQEAHRLWKQGEAVILDVRSTEEYQSGHIPGALNIHAGRVLNRAGQIPSGQPVIVHCQSGGRSSIAISALMAAGFKNLYNLSGGIIAWKEAGHPVEP